MTGAVPAPYKPVTNSDCLPGILYLGPVMRDSHPIYAHALRFVALSITLTQLASADQQAPEALSVEWQGKHSCEALFEDDEIRVARCTFPPGAVHKRHKHPAYLTYVLSGGNAEIKDGSGRRQVDLTVDALLTSKPIPWHEFTNIGNTTIHVLVVEKKYEPVLNAGDGPQK